MEVTFVVELTLLQKYQQGKGEYIRYSARLTYPISYAWLRKAFCGVICEKKSLFA
jgi:hypothetical protein